MPVTKYLKQFGVSSPQTRALDFMLAVGPMLTRISEQGFLHAADVNLVAKCGSALPMYAEDLSRSLERVEELWKRLQRYEDWRVITEPPSEHVNPLALFHFYGVETIEETWWTGTWDERPTWATHYCAIVSPLGPPEDMLDEER